MIYRLLSLLALVLVGVAVWLTLAPRPLEPVAALAHGPSGADQGYSATDAWVIETGADGRPLYTLQAQQVQQDADTNLIHLSSIRMTFHDSAGGQWQARADRATARQDTAQIDLMGAVDVSGNFAGNDQPAHILTQRLSVDTRADVIRTRLPVRLNWAGVAVDARGLLVNAKEQTVKLESDVHGHFAP